MAQLRLHQHMHVIRHHHKGIEPVTFALKATQSIRYDFCRPFVAQRAFAVAFVQPFFRTFDKARFVFARGFVIPRLRMKFEPIP